MARAANNATTWALAVFDSDLSPAQKLICLYLRTHMNDYRDMAWPAVGRIAARCGMSDRTVQRHLPKICEAGYLVANGYGPAGTVRYAIVTPDNLSPPQICRNTPADLSPELNKELTNRVCIGKFKRPTDSEIAEYATSIGFDLDPHEFLDFYESKGWMVGKNKMKNWQAAVRTWKKSRETKNVANRPGGHAGQNRQSKSDAIREATFGDSW